MTRAWIAVLGLAACATTQPPETPSPSGAPEWTVRPRSRWNPSTPLLVGPYEAHRIERHGVRQRGGIVDALKGKTEYQQRYEFVLRDTASARDVWAVRCDNRDVEQGVRLAGVELSLADRASLECTLQPPGDPARAWALRVTGSDESAPSGEMHRDTARIGIEGQNPPGGVAECCRPESYLLRRGGAVAGLVHNDRRRVRVAPGTPRDDESLLAATAIALLLQTGLIDDS